MEAGFVPAVTVAARVVLLPAVKEAGVALNYSLDGTYDHRFVVDFTNVTMGTGGYAAGRTTVSTQDLVTNSIRVLYQFFKSL